MSDAEFNRRQEIVEAGKELIRARDFRDVAFEDFAVAADASIDEIQTLIGRREELLALIVRAYTQEVQAKIFEVTPAGKSTEDFLHEFAANYLKIICASSSIRSFRYAAGLGISYPHISTQFKATAREGGADFADLLEYETDLVLPDGFTWIDASSCFFGLCRGAFHHQLIFDVDFVVSDREIEEQASKAVAAFLKIFSAEK